MPDRYRNFADLAAREQRGRDYRIYLADRGSPVTILAPHGGRIEPGTSAIARKIAGTRYNCYCFEGIRPRNNGRLHITSHRFDEPSALKMVSLSGSVITVHACKGTEPVILMGGLDTGLSERLCTALLQAGFRSVARQTRFPGRHPRNICNRGQTGKGVQMEISRGIRDSVPAADLLGETVGNALAARAPGP